MQAGAPPQLGAAASSPRPFAGDPSNETVLLKLALSNEQCGALIGKGGSAITTLQRGCGVLIKAASVGGSLRNYFGGALFSVSFQLLSHLRTTLSSPPTTPRRRTLPGHNLPGHHRAWDARRHSDGAAGPHEDPV